MVSCLDQSSEVPRNHSDLRIHGDQFFLKDRVFEGTLVAHHSDGSLQSKTPYQDGRVHGKMISWYPSGQIESERFYQNGLSVGRHKGWHRNGNPRFLYEFQDGKHHGEFWQWYDDQTLYSYREFIHGQELGHKKWRHSGKIYANYIHDQKENKGLLGGKLCEKVEDQ